MKIQSKGFSDYPVYTQKRFYLRGYLFPLSSMRMDFALHRDFEKLRVNTGKTYQELLIEGIKYLLKHYKNKYYRNFNITHGIKRYPKYAKIKAAIQKLKDENNREYNIY